MPDDVVSWTYTGDVNTGNYQMSTRAGCPRIDPIVELINRAVSTELAKPEGRALGKEYTLTVKVEEV
jgi:hypothetical protein